MLELGSRAAQKSGNSNHRCQACARPFGSWSVGSCPWQWAGQMLGREELDVSWTTWEAGPLRSQSPVWTPAWPLPETLSNASAAPLHLELRLPLRSLSLLLQGCCLCSSLDSATTTTSCQCCFWCFFVLPAQLALLTAGRESPLNQSLLLSPASDVAARESLSADSLPAYLEEECLEQPLEHQEFLFLAKMELTAGSLSASFRLG